MNTLGFFFFSTLLLGAALCFGQGVALTFDDLPLNGDLPPGVTRDTAEKRRAVRTYLHDHGYRIAEVTLDYEDYLWSSAYAHCVASHDAQSIAGLTQSYLSIASAYIDRDREMAKLLFGHDINHVLLLHLGAFSSTILPQLLDLLHQKGLRLITLEEAESDPAYQSDPDAGSRFGGSLLEQLMDVKKIPYPKLPPKPYKELQSWCRPS